MQTKFIRPILVLLSLIAPLLGLGKEHAIVWKVNYYSAIPNAKGISTDYCKHHAPGTFIGIVSDQLAHGAVTNHGIKLDRFTFHVSLRKGIYFMHGTARATGKTDSHLWHDYLYYYVYKLTKLGITRGVWSSRQCKGFLLGQVVSK